MLRPTAAEAPQVESDVLYLGYIDGEDDVDLYGFDSTPLAQVGVRLSHLAGDGDLVVYGPATDRPGQLAVAGADPHRDARRAAGRRRGPRHLRPPATRRSRTPTPVSPCSTG